MNDKGPDGTLPAQAAAGPRVWIPRPVDDAAALADELRPMGIQGLIAPVMAISYRSTGVRLDNIAAVLFTSANGVRAFAQQNQRRDLPVYAVGANTAETARTLGFGDVYVADGDVDKLADMVAEHRRPGQGTLLHVAGSTRAGDLAGLLTERGFTVDRQVLYDALPATELPAAVADALDDGAIDAIALFSPRTARIVCDLLVAAERQDAAPALTAICLSANVAEAAGGLDWREIVIAQAPDRGSLLQAVRLALQTVGAETVDAPDATAKEAVIDPIGINLTGTDAPLPGETMNDTTNENSAETTVEAALDAETVIDRFGGIRPMAQKLGVTPSTIQGWKARNNIPENRWDEIRDVAAKEGISLSGMKESAQSGAEAPTEALPQPAEQSDVIEEGNTSASAEKEEAETEEEVEPPVASAKPDQESKPEQDVSASPPPPPAAGTPRRPSGTAWVALILAIATAAGVVTQSYWRPGVENALNAHLSQFFGPPPPRTPAPPDPALAEQVGVLIGRIDALENRPAPEIPASAEAVDIDAVLAPLSDRMTALEDALAATPATSPDQIDLTPLKSAIDALRSRVNAMDDQSDTSLEAFRAELSTFADQFDAIRAGIQTVTDRAAAVERRLAQLESAYGGPSGSEAALVLTVGQLDNLLASSEPFGGTLEDIAALAPDDQAVQDAVASLTPLKDTVIPSRAQIIEAFEDVAPIVDRVERTAGAEGWVDETLAELRGLVSIRRTDATEDAPAVSRAEAALDKGDLAGAVAAVEPLAGEDPAIAAWVTKAKQRVAATASLKALRDAALARLRMAATGG